MTLDTLIRAMIRRRQLSIAWVTAPIHEEAVELFRRYSDQEFSIVDCTSFVVARRRGVREVFGFDRHFATMGFVLRPS
jgi:predicted nucleic acid-binding protein